MKYLPVIIVNALLFIGFGVAAAMLGNLEFLGYIGVNILIGLVILVSMRKVTYPMYVLWMLTIWSFAHMAGGLFPYGDTVWYNFIFVNLIGDPYLILKYDQVVHFYGFFTATLVAYAVLKDKISTWSFGTALIVFLAGMGFGAANEIVEFFAVVLIPETNVGGYINTGIDLVANGLGALAAILFINWRR